MAISYSIKQKGVLGNWRANVVDITLDGSYAGGGYDISAASCGVDSIMGFFCQMQTGENLLPNFNLTTGKLEVLKGASTVTVTSGNAAFSELASNDSLISSSSIVRALVIGTSATGT